VTKEFALILDQSKRGPHHCAEHAHIVKGRLLRLVWICVAVAIVGTAILAVAMVVGAVLLGVGVGAGVLAYLADRHRAATIQESRPPLPLVPNIEQVRISESVSGRLVLDDKGRYDAPVHSVTGELVIATTLGKNDRDRLANYRMIYQLDDADVEFSAGFAVLHGPMGLRFLDGQLDRPTIPLAGKVSEVPFLGTQGGRPTGQWQIRRGYDLQPSTKIDQLPLWLTPSVRAGSDQRNLELELQWVDFLPDDISLELDTVLKLEITVPHTWGHIESVGPFDATVGQAGGHLELTRFRPAKAEDRRLKVSVQFENPINMSQSINGHLEIVFRNTISGVDAVTIHHPLGHQREVDEKKIERTITFSAEFELSLAGIRYQDQRVVPDSKLEQDRQKQETVTFPGVIPDYQTVVKLTDAMSDHYYVKSVVENPPRSGGRVSVLTRTWDITGRRYDGVYPVDFHIVLTGEELHRGDIRAHSGHTKMQLSVQGIYANAEMQELIVQVWEALHDLVVDTLNDRSRDTAADRSTAQDEAELASEWMDRQASSDEDQVRRQRLDDATDALLAGRISEQTYQEIRARIEQDAN
jgi:hypothetical protein